PDLSMGFIIRRSSLRLAAGPSLLAMAAHQGIVKKAQLSSFATRASMHRHAAWASNSAACHTASGELRTNPQTSRRVGHG
ncbi:hypothetical protein, partial [Roseateles sp.]|uniref:hypothetical protein n=1 Tax=Roseateles sp. TaxID=1971397 RepID=UPI003918EB47